MKRTIATMTVGVAAVLALSACGGQRDDAQAGSDADADSCDPGSGRVNIATGNSTGVYYVMGGGFAELINSETDLQATSAETGASVQNIEQVVDGDYDIGFSLADTAADAINGNGDFDSPQDIATLGRIYPNYTQVVVRKDAGIDTIADFEGKTISTGSPKSGTEVIANRLIDAAGLDLDDVHAQRLDLTQTIAGMKDGSIDGFVWSGGLPTPALTDLFTSMGEDMSFLDPTPLLPKLKKVNEVYTEGAIPAATYGTDGDIPTVVVPNVLVVRADMPANLACGLTKLLYSETDQLVNVHPAAKDILVETAAETKPIPMHLGSQRALDDLN